MKRSFVPEINAFVRESRASVHECNLFVREISALVHERRVKVVRMLMKLVLLFANVVRCFLFCF